VGVRYREFTSGYPLFTGLVTLCRGVVVLGRSRCNAFFIIATGSCYFIRVYAIRTVLPKLFVGGSRSMAVVLGVYTGSMI